MVKQLLSSTTFRASFLQPP